MRSWDDGLDGNSKLEFEGRDRGLGMGVPAGADAENWGGRAEVRAWEWVLEEEAWVLSTRRC